jgi:hypothetical protein
VGANISETSSYLEIHPYSLVSDATVAAWLPYVCTAAPDDSIGDEAEKFQPPAEWIFANRNSIFTIQYVTKCDQLASAHSQRICTFR